LKWALIGCVAVVIIGLLGLAAIVIVVFGAIKSTDAYKGARDRAQRDPRVIAALGTPMETGIWVSGNVKIENSSGSADFEFPLSGPKGEARVHAVATLDTSGWQYTVLTVSPKNGPPIDLLKP
jgi:hypothetical protein